MRYPKCEASGQRPQLHFPACKLTGAEMTSTLASIADGPNPDGSHDVTIDHNGEKLTINIPLPRVQELIAKFQARIFTMSQQTQFPQLAVDRIEVAHKESICELMVSTVQTGTVVLAMSDKDLRQMKQEVERVLAYRAAAPQ